MESVRRNDTHATTRMVGGRDDRRQVAMTFALTVVGAMAGMIGAIGLHGL